MSDITEAIEQDAIADTLVAPLPSAYEEQHADADYRYDPAADDGVENALDQPSDELGEVEPDALQVTPEEQAEFQQQQEVWNSLPQEQREQFADQHLQEAYGEAYDTITPQQATTFTNDFGKTHWGVDNLSERIEPQAFAAFSESWSSNAERTIAIHPNGPAFLEALSGNDPQQALQLAQSMTDSVMSERFYSHFRTLLGDELVQGYTPQTFAAKCFCDLARLQGWGAQRESGNSARASRSGFQTNQDIFDSETLDRFQTL